MVLKFKYWPSPGSYDSEFKFIKLIETLNKLNKILIFCIKHAKSHYPKPNQEESMLNNYKSSWFIEDSVQKRLKTTSELQNNRENIHENSTLVKINGTTAAIFIFSIENYHSILYKKTAVWKIIWSLTTEARAIHQRQY